MPETSVKGLTPLAFNEIAGANACRNQPEQGYGLAPQPEHPHANDLKVASCWEKKYERGPQHESVIETVGSSQPQSQVVVSALQFKARRELCRPGKISPGPGEEEIGRSRKGRAKPIRTSGGTLHCCHQRRPLGIKQSSAIAGARHGFRASDSMEREPS